MQALLIARAFFALLTLSVVLAGVLLARSESPSVQAQASSLYSWSSGATSPIKRFEGQGLAVGNKLYLLGGFYNTSLQATAQFHSYTPGSNSYARLADMPQILTHAGVAVDGDSIYVVGGYLGNNPGGSVANVWRYSISKNSWSAAPSLPAPRGAGAAAIVGDQLHFFGGGTRSANNLSSTTDTAEHWALDLDGGTAWELVGSFPGPRNHLAAVTLDNKIYAIGGQLRQLEGTTAQARVDVFDPATNTWERLADLPGARSHVAAFAMYDSIVVAGGSVNDGGSGRAITDVVRYDPASDLWSSLPPLPGKRKTPIGDFVNGSIVIANGGTGDPTDTMWVSSPIAAPTARPTASSTATPSSTTTATATATEAATDDATATATATEAATDDATATTSPSATASATPTQTATASPSATASATPTQTATASPSATASATPTQTSNPTAAGASYSFGAVADAFVDSAKPTTSHGDWGQLLVVGQSAGSTKQGLVRFNVSGLPAGAQVRSARLRLSVTNDSTSGGSIYALASNSWSESVTWNGRPSLSGTALASLGSVAQGQVVEVDVSGLVSGNGSYSFAIVHPSNNNNHLGYGSREASASSTRPLLILSTE